MEVEAAAIKEREMTETTADGKEAETEPETLIVVIVGMVMAVATTGGTKTTETEEDARDLEKGRRRGTVMTIETETGIETQRAIGTEIVNGNEKDGDS